MLPRLHSQRGQSIVMVVVFMVSLLGNRVNGTAYIVEMTGC
jgi:hypothetical protein